VQHFRRKYHIPHSIEISQHIGSLFNVVTHIFFIQCGVSNHYRPIFSEFLRSVTSHTAVQTNTLQNTAALQRTITCCNMLQHAATRCNAMQPIATHCTRLGKHIGSHCNTLQHTAPRCNTLQHTATHCTTPQQHCNTLQHTETRLLPATSPAAGQVNTPFHYVA